MRSAALQRTGVLAGVAATLLAMVSVQSGAAIAITLFATVGPVAVVALRLVTASAFLVSTARPPAAALRTPMVATLAGYGLVIAGMNCCFYLAIERVPLGVAVALEMVGPIAVAIVGSRRPRDLAAAALAAPSVLVLALAHGVDGPVTAAGVALALGAGACWGGYILLSAHHARRLPGAQGLALAMTIAAVPVMLLALAGVRGRPAVAARSGHRRRRRPALDGPAGDARRDRPAPPAVRHLRPGAQPVARGRRPQRLRDPRPAAQPCPVGGRGAGDGGECGRRHRCRTAGRRGEHRTVTDST